MVKPLSAWKSRSVVYSVAFIQVLAAAVVGVTAGPVGRVRGLSALAAPQGLTHHRHHEISVYGMVWYGMHGSSCMHDWIGLD